MSNTDPRPHLRALADPEVDTRFREIVREARFRVDLRGRLGWALDDQAQRLNRWAHRLSGGDVPENGYLSVNHLDKVAHALGMEVSELVRVVEDRGNREYLR